MTIAMLPPLLAIVAAGGIFLFFFGIYMSLAAVPSVEDRLRRYGGQPTAAATRSPMRVRGDRTQNSSVIGQQLTRSLGRGAYGARIGRDLARADLKMTASEFILVNMGLTVVLGMLGFVVGHGAIGAIILAIIGYFAPRIWLGFMKGRRLRQFNNQLADAIGLLANSLRTGYSLPQSMDLLARDGRPPISVEFARVNREVGLGLPTADALNNMLDRVPSDDLELMVTAINIQRDVGGNLAEVLDSIAETIRDRVKLFGEIKVLTAQQAISGYVISALPVLLGAVLFLLNPTYFGTMFKTVCGWILLSCAALGIGSGFFVMKRITNIRV